MVITMNNKYEPETLHDTWLSFSETLTFFLLIYLIYRYIKCLIISRSFLKAFPMAVFNDAAPLIIAVLLISIIIPFSDWALYALLKRRVLKKGEKCNGTIIKEIKQGRISKGGGYNTYKYLVKTDHGDTFKSTVYTSPLYKKNCVVHKYLCFKILTDFE